ncbi:ABC transporter permease [Thermococcus sp. 21S7]|uniref:ABC transporter permease n=1 Tax=Thermococcus sp. 21S7 TaxID=1638221 RepID=UPI00143B8AD9|nr:ABC transporter permease [Thermococcus sp. 21S7]NJE61365.1 ABC transporter permease [Thermococcus sp. 21S7]
MGRAVMNIAMKDFEIGIKTKKFHITMALFIVLSLVMVYNSKRLGMNGELYRTPFQMLFLTGFSNAFNYSIALLGVLLGGTTIAEEIENGTLKLVISRPVYRDEILFGKLVGSLLILGTALSLFYVLTVAFALIFGISVAKEDLIKFLATLPFSMLYGLVFLSLGLLVSTFIRKSRNALVMSIFLFVFFGFLLSIIAGVVAFALAGLPPVPNIPENAANLTEDQLQEMLLKDPAYQAWLTKLTITAERILYISPNYHYQEIIRMIFGGKPKISEIISALAYEGSIVEERPIAESLGLVWGNIVMLSVMSLLSLVVAYAKFIRVDLG